MPPTPARARFGTLLRELRRAKHLTQRDIGRAVHLTPDAVAAWEKSRHLPDQRAAETLDRYLHADGALLEAWHAARAETTAQADTSADYQPIGHATPTDARSVLTAAAHAAAAFGTWAEKLDTGEVAINALAVRARRIATGALTQPPATVAARAADLAAETFTALRDRHHKPVHARDLYVVAGSVSALLAWLAGDLGDLDAARLHGCTAALCADHADQADLHAWVASVRSKTALWAGDYQAAAHTEATRVAVPLDTSPHVRHS